MKKHMLAAIVACSTLPTGTAAAEDLPSWLTERRIIGDNDLEPVEATFGTDIYDKARVVARVETVDGSGFCSASRIAEDMFLTNFHCWEFRNCDSTVFHMGYERDLPLDQHEYYRCVEVLAKDLSLDYAVYRVEKVAPLSGSSEVFDFEGIDLDVPDNDSAGVSKTFEVNLDETIKNIKVNLKATHDYLGDLQVKLTAPDGTTAILFNRERANSKALDLTLTGSVALSSFLGKNAAGTWTLEARDFADNDVGTINSLTIEIFYDNGELELPATENDYPVATLWAGAVEVDQLLISASHPRARFKEVDRSDNCKLTAVVPEIVASRQSITHTCDTEGGSSGSPILDRETGYIVALHWGGMNEYNLAIPMNFIVAHLRANISTTHFEKLSIQR